MSAVYHNTKKCNHEGKLSPLEERAFLQDPACPLVADYDIETFLEAEGFDPDHPHHFEALDLMVGHLISARRAYELRQRKNLGVIQISPFVELNHNIEPVNLGTSTPVWRKIDIRRAYAFAVLLHADLSVAAHTRSKLERYFLIYDARKRFREAMAKISLGAMQFNLDLLFASVPTQLADRWSCQHKAPVPKVAQRVTGEEVAA